MCFFNVGDPKTRDYFQERGGGVSLSLCFSFFVESGKVSWNRWKRREGFVVGFWCEKVVGCWIASCFIPTFENAWLMTSNSQRMHHFNYQMMVKTHCKELSIFVLSWGKRVVHPLADVLHVGFYEIGCLSPHAPSHDIRSSSFLWIPHTFHFKLHFFL